MKKIFISSQMPISLQDKIHKKLLRNFNRTFINDAEIVLCDVNPIDATKFPNAKYFIINATNADHIHNIRDDQALISLRGEDDFLRTITSTSELTIALTLMLLRNLKQPCSTWNRYNYTGHALRNKSVGIIGYGRIGRQVEGLFRSFGCKEVKYFDPYYSLLSERSEVLMWSDIVTIHASFNKTLKSGNFMIRDSDICNMKKGAYLINTARPCFDEDLIYRHHKHFSGIALDVMYDEPVPKMFHKLKDLDNVIITPHIGGCTEDDMTTTSEFICDKLMKRILEDDQTT